MLRVSVVERVLAGGGFMTPIERTAYGLSMLFAVLAVAAQPDRDYIREKTLEGQQAGERDKLGEAAPARRHRGGQRWQ